MKRNASTYRSVLSLEDDPVAGSEVGLDSRYNFGPVVRTTRGSGFWLRWILTVCSAAAIVYASVVGIHYIDQHGLTLLPSSVSTPKVASRAVPVTNPSATSLSQVWANLLVGRQGTVDIAVYNHDTGQTTHYSNSGGTFYTASVVKVSILEALLVEDQAAGQAITQDQLSLAAPMIENSNDDDATDLWVDVGGALAMNNLFNQIGATSTTPGQQNYWGLTQTTALDQLKVVNAYAYPGPLLSDSSEEVADSLMNQIEADQLWGVSYGVPSGVSIQLKDGWLPEANGWICNSIGHVHGDGVDYTIAVLTAGNPSEQYGITTIQNLASATWKRLA